MSCCPTETDLTHFPTCRVELLSTVFPSSKVDDWLWLWWDAQSERTVPNRADEVDAGWRAMTATSKASSSKEQAVLLVEEDEDLSPDNIFIKTVDTGRLRVMGGRRPMEVEVLYHKSQAAFKWDMAVFPVLHELEFLNACYEYTGDIITFIVIRLDEQETLEQAIEYFKLMARAENDPRLLPLLASEFHRMSHHFHSRGLYQPCFAQLQLASNMVQSAVLGFPRIGDKRQVKKALESYWGGKIDAAALQKVAAETRLARWETLKAAGVDSIPSGDFTLYDHSLDFSTTFNVIPAKYAAADISELDRYFAMGRGRQVAGVDLPAQEMQKWFDSNYHYIKGEISSHTEFKLSNTKPVDEYVEAKAAGIVTRPVLLGPITYLLLGKTGRDEESASFTPIDVLDKLVPVFGELLAKLQAAGATEVQIDEPALVLDATKNLGAQYASTYAALAKAAPGLKITLATYFGRLDENVSFVAKLPVHSLHIDLDRAAGQLDGVLAAIKPTKLVLSLGLISGRNIWKNDLAASIKVAEKVIAELGADRVVVATSSSLLHTPVTLKSETALKPEVADWFSFATEKAYEVATLAKALTAPAEAKAALEANAVSIKARRDFETQSDKAVRERLAAVTPDMYDRKNPFPARKAAQHAVCPLPAFPTTTIGSFPQTKEIRLARANLGKGTITTAEYDAFIEKEIKSVVDIQEEIGLDMLVHGEPERNDMVQYFGERLTGFVFTEMAWVQSYGSRYVRPPIIVSDVSRPEAMTVRWSAYAQSLSKLPVKGMLTGPVTILNWSFPRVDVSREVQSKQLALALRDEVIDLETAGIFAIQVDEPAIREGLPLREVDWDEYLTWAVDSFRLATAGVKDSTQTHSHFCYSDFNAIFSHIIKLDADVISIEASKSDLKLLEVFKTHNYPNSIGPGLYDIHSPRVPTAEEMQEKIAGLLKAIPQAKEIVVNPDCGLKTRAWPETIASLKNLVTAAKWARATYPQ
ncbi:hypothetical protein RQP46_002682 [Phenoliferia psychrophenolica]